MTRPPDSLAVKTITGTNHQTSGNWGKYVGSPSRPPHGRRRPSAPPRSLFSFFPSRWSSPLSYPSPVFGQPPLCFDFQSFSSAQNAQAMLAFNLNIKSALQMPKHPNRNIGIRSQYQYPAMLVINQNAMPRLPTQTSKLFLCRRLSVWVLRQWLSSWIWTSAWWNQNDVSVTRRMHAHQFKNYAFIFFPSWFTRELNF